MTDTTNFRMERIEKLLAELRYEIERGMMNKDIGEELTYRFFVPFSSKIINGAVFCEFHTRPVPHHMVEPGSLEPRLRRVKG